MPHPKNLSHPISAIPCLILFAESHLPDPVCDTPGPSDTPLNALCQGNMLPTPKLQGICLSPLFSPITAFLNRH